MVRLGNEDSYKIQAVVDLFQEFFPFQINGKGLETLIVQGGMGVDLSTRPLGLASGATGSAGTITTTFSKHLDEIIRDGLPANNIVGTNNLVAVSDYGKMHDFAKEIGADFIASGAGIDKLVSASIKNQANQLGNNNHLWTIPIVSRVDQLQGRLRRNCGYVILESGEAGGHNGTDDGHNPENRILGLNDTIAKYRAAKFETGDNKVIYAGGVRTPHDFVEALDAGFDAVQIGTLLLNAAEANVNPYFRSLVANSKPKDVGRIVSPTGLPAMGFQNYGVMKRTLSGEDASKDDCIGCLAHGCEHVQASAKFAGIKTPVGDYCLKDVLYGIHPTLGDPNPDNGLYFCGARPEEMFTRQYLSDGNLVLPTRFIIGKLLSGAYDDIVGRSEFYGRIKGEHREYLISKCQMYAGGETMNAKVINYDSGKF